MSIARTMESSEVQDPHVDSNSTDRLDRFKNFFRYQMIDIQEQIRSLKDRSTAGGEQSKAIEYCSAAISRLSNNVRDASSYLPAHDQKTYGDAVKALSELLQKEKLLIQPRQKFSFKKKNASAISIADAAELASKQRHLAPGMPGYNSDTSAFSSVSQSPYPASPAPEPATSDVTPEHSENAAAAALGTDSSAAIRRPSLSQQSSVNLSSVTDMHINLPSSSAHATTSGKLLGITRCVINMSVPTAVAGHPFAGLTLRNIAASLIVCGRVNGATHVTGVRDSIIVVTTRQFRIHESSNVDVYLWCASRPGVEDCSGLRFAPLPSLYMTDEESEAKNSFDQIDDFKWLKAEQSPNWSILDGDRRVADHIWRDVVRKDVLPGTAGTDAKSILKAVGMPIVKD